MVGLGAAITMMEFLYKLKLDEGGDDHPNHRLLRGDRRIHERAGFESRAEKDPALEKLSVHST